MLLTYLKEDKLYTTKETNDDVIITVTKDKNKRKVVIQALTDITLNVAEYLVKYTIEKTDYVFLNGYQSWTDTKEYLLSEKQNNLKNVPNALVKKYAFRASGDQFFYDFPSGTLHGFDIMYIKGARDFFLGSKNEKNAYLIMEISKTGKEIRLLADIEGKELHKGETFPVFDFFVDHDIKNGMHLYFKDKTLRTDKKLFGYTSWYNHYTNINEKLILEALSRADERFELFQIDDGFETYVGDWLDISKTKFPNGLVSLVSKIHDKNMLAGIWLAPFVAEKESMVVKEHPDWIATDNDGQFILAGPNWSGFYPLDLENEEVIDYIRLFLRFYKDLGFDFFKLDFLFAANLKPLKGLTRAQTSQKMYKLLREELGDKLILGCGGVVTNSFETFDYLRIGPDVSLKFDDVFYMKFLHRERISTKVTLQNTVYRSFMNGKAFLNDPDVFLLRDTNISLTKEQRKALTYINALFGSLFMTSDNPKDYDEEKRKILDEALTLFRSATSVSFKRDGQRICIHYKVNETPYSFMYDTKKGCIIYG